MNKPVCVVIGVGCENADRTSCSLVTSQATAIASFNSQANCDVNSKVRASNATLCPFSENLRAIAAPLPQIRAQLGEIASLIYNAGAGSWGTVEEISAAAFESNWRVNALGALLATQQVIPAMRKSLVPAILFL